VSVALPTEKIVTTDLQTETSFSLLFGFTPLKGSEFTTT